MTHYCKIGVAFLSTFVALTTSVMAQPAKQDALAVPAACLAPLRPDEHDSAVRDLTVARPSPKEIDATLCIVSGTSNTPIGFSYIIRSVNIFRKNGSFIATGGIGTVQNIGPVVGGDPNAPKMIVWPTAAKITLDPQSGDLLDEALVLIEWAQCRTPFPDCVRAADLTTPFILPISLNDPITQQGHKQ